MMNVNAGESSNEYFYEINGEQIDTDGDNFFDKFHIYYDPDTSVEEYVTVDVEFDVYADGQHIGHAAEYHEIFNGDENVYHMNYTADYQSEYDFYVALYDGDNLEDEHWFYDISLRAPGNGSEEEEEFVCDNGNTIPMDWYDDGYDDCGDGSDEPNQGGDDDFVCDNGNTIPMDWYNDGWDDCGDWSDEPNLGADQFICDNGELVLVTWVNDYYEDCGDGSDELLGDGFVDTWFVDVGDCQSGCGVWVTNINEYKDNITVGYELRSNVSYSSYYEGLPSLVVGIQVYNSYTNALVDESYSFLEYNSSIHEGHLFTFNHTVYVEGSYDIRLSLVNYWDGDLEDIMVFTDIMVGGDADFICDNGETIPMDWYDDGWDDCGDGSDEPYGVDSDDDGEDDLGFGFPTGQLGIFLDETGGPGHEENLAINFVTPQMAEVEATSRIDLDAEMADTLREDIILATIVADVEAYFVEGKPEIEAAYASGDADMEDTLEAYFILYENATASAVPGYGTAEDADFFGDGFNTVENIREQTEFDDMEITQSHLDTYYDVAWGNGMNNMLTMDMTLTFLFFLAFMAAFSGEEVDEEQLNATMETMVRSSVTDCPESLDGFGVLSCVMEKFEVASMELFGGNMFEDESDADDFDDYCLDNDNMMLKEAGGGCSSSDTGVFYNANEDDMGMTMDGMNSIDAIGLMTEPGGFPLLWPEMTAFVNTENILGVFSENAGKNASIEIGMTLMVFFPGVETGDSHMFAFEPKEGEAPNVQVSPPAGYSLENDPDSMTWNFTKSGDLGEEVDESGLPGPGLLVILLTILGVASVRRRF